MRRMIAKREYRVDGPLSMTMHGKKPNEIVHFDFLFMGQRTDGLKYVLVVRDDLSLYLWLCPAETAEAEVVVIELKIWIRVFTVMG